jgi:hypothetical protein
MTEAAAGQTMSSPTRQLRRYRAGGRGARGGCSRQIRVRRRASSWRPRAPPLSRPLPPELQGGEEMSPPGLGLVDTDRTGARRGPLPRCAGERGEFDCAATSFRRSPSVTPPPQFGGGVARRREERAKGRAGERTRGRGGGPAAGTTASDASGNRHLQRRGGVQEFGISCRIPPLLPFASACESLACSIPMTAECRPASAQKRPWGVRRSNLSVAGPSPAWLARAVSLAHLYRSPTR